jgi:predicted O-methyltransferase YrrM
MWKALDYRAKTWYFRHCLAKLAKGRSRQDLEALLDFTFSFGRGLIRPLQIPGEIRQLLQLLEQKPPRRVLEIGTARGGTLFLFCQLAAADATIISLDLPQGQFGGGYPPWKVPFYRSFARPGQQVHLQRDDSHRPETLEQITGILQGRKLDLLFIDGDHTYAGVRRDFEMYAPLVQAGGLIVLHDIVVHKPETGCEVNRFWEEIKSRYPHREFVSDWGQRWAGLGVLFVSS